MISQYRYFLGCPVWSNENWKGIIYPPAAKRHDWLSSYCRYFNTVEGNTTFYAIPQPETVQKWARESAIGFRFALKFPRVISHECKLTGCQLELEKFLDCLMILNDAERLGPTFLQLPPDFDGKHFSNLQKFLEQLPEELAFAVEVRHSDYFQDPWEGKLRQMLLDRKMDRVLFDSSALFHFPPADMSESEARRRKPNVPIRHEGLSQHPFLRLIGINRIEKLQPWIEEWANRVSRWIQEGKTPYVFTHTADDQYSPDFARKFHDAILKRLPEIPQLPEFGDGNEKQLSLFD